MSRYAILAMGTITIIARTRSKILVALPCMLIFAILAKAARASNVTIILYHIQISHTVVTNRQGAT